MDLRADGIVMDFITRLFLESPILLGVLSFLTFSCVLLVRPRLPEKPAKYSLPVTFLAIPALFTLQYGVVTQREAIRHELSLFINAIEEENEAGYAAALSISYDHEGMNHAAIRSFITDRLQSMHVYDTRITSAEIDLKGNSADMDLLVVATVSIQGGIGDRHVGRWNIRWQLENGKWSITAISPRMIDMMQIGSWRELRTVAPP